MPAILGDRIRESRRKMNMTQGELAGNDYSVSYISAIERNKIRPSLRALAWLASRLNVNLSDLLATDTPIFGEFGGSGIEDELQVALTGAQTALANHRYKEARDQLLAVQGTVRVPSQRIHLNLLLGEAFIALNQGSEAKDVLEQNLSLTRDVDAVTQEYTRNLLGQAYNLMNMYMMSVECHRQCLQAIESGIVRDPSFKLAVLNNLGTDYLLLGQHEEAVKCFQQATEIGQRLLTPQSIAELYWEISADLRRDGQMHAAQRYADMASEHLKAAANRAIFARVQSSLGLAYAEQKDTVNAEKTLKQAFELAEKAGDVQGRSIALASLSRVQLARGAKKEALTSAEQAVASAEQSSENEALGRAYLALGEAMAANGQNADADKRFEKGLKYLEKAGSLAELARAFERYADILDQRGDVTNAFAYLKKARAMGLSNR